MLRLNTPFPAESLWLKPDNFTRMACAAENPASASLGGDCSSLLSPAKRRRSSGNSSGDTRRLSRNSGRHFYRDGLTIGWVMSSSESGAPVTRSSVG